MSKNILSNLCHPWLTVEFDENDRPTITKCTPDADGTLIIPEGITSISYEAFKDCRLKNIVIPESVEYIQEDAFKGCNDALFCNYDECRYIGTPWNPFKFLISPIYPDNISHCRIHPYCEIICDGAFERCYNLRSVVFNNKIREIGVWAFRFSWLSEVEIPATLSEIAPFTFEHCHNLRKVKVPDSVTIIGTSAFEGCLNLESIDLPTGIKIEDHAFWGCQTLGPDFPYSTESKYINLSID